MERAPSMASFVIAANCIIIAINVLGTLIGISFHLYPDLWNHGWAIVWITEITIWCAVVGFGAYGFYAGWDKQQHS